MRWCLWPWRKGLRIAMSYIVLRRSGLRRFFGAKPRWPKPARLTTSAMVSLEKNEQKFARIPRRQSRGKMPALQLAGRRDRHRIAPRSCSPWPIVFRRRGSLPPQATPARAQGLSLARLHGEGNLSDGRDRGLSRSASCRKGSSGRAEKAWRSPASASGCFVRSGCWRAVPAAEAFRCWISMPPCSAWSIGAEWRRAQSAATHQAGEAVRSRPGDRTGVEAAFRRNQATLERDAALGKQARARRPGTSRG